MCRNGPLLFLEERSEAVADIAAHIDSLVHLHYVHE